MPKKTKRYLPLAAVLLGLLAPNGRLSAAEGAPAALASIVLAKAELDKAAWGASARVDGKPCRLLQAGKRGAIPLPAWWGTGPRPKKGTAFRARIEFKDTAAAPIRVEAFAGLPGRYELHRIGGLHDGRWKSAVVPVPWDLIMRLPEPADGPAATRIYLSAPGGKDAAAVPVARIAITKGEARLDEARWAAQTRAWVARVQGEKRIRAKRPKAQTPVLPETFKDRKVVPFTRSYLRLIHTTSAPQPGEAGAPLHVNLARNEIEPAQFGVHAHGAALRNVRVSLDPAGLVDAQGNKLKAKIELFTAEYSVVRRGALFPQRLWPAYPVDIPQGRSHLFWVNVSTFGASSKPGRYRGAIRVQAEGRPPARLVLAVRVRPITLLSMRESKLQMGSCVTGLLPAHELRFLVRHNQNSINLWFSSFQPRIIKNSKTEFDLDFTIADDVMKRAAEAGIESVVWFLGGNPYGYPDTLHLERELYRQVHYDGTDRMAGRKEYIQRTTAHKGKLLPELRALYKQWVKKVMAHAGKKGWPEIILTPFDEPAKWVQGHWASAEVYYVKDRDGPWHTVAKVKKKDRAKFLKEHRARNRLIEDWGPGGAGIWIKGHFKDACAAIHEAWPKARIYGSIHHAKAGLPFLPDIEVFCTNAIHEDPKLGDKVRAAGPQKTFWQYSGCGDDRGPAEGRYTFGFYFAAFGSRGSLCWAYNWGSRFDTSRGNQWLYAWTTPYSVVRAPFFEGMREAWDDRCYIETLKAAAGKAGKEKEARALLESIFNRAVKTRTGGGRDTVNDFFARTKDPEALDTGRVQIADLLVKLTR